MINGARARAYGSARERFASIFGLGMYLYTCYRYSRFEIILEV